MTDNKKRIVRILVRLQNRFDAIETKWNEAADRDAAVDAGEFSGPASGRAAEKECDAAARALGFASQIVALDIAHLLRATVRYPAYYYGADVSLPL